MRPLQKVPPFLSLRFAYASYGHPPFQVTIKRIERVKRKHVTSVHNLEAFGKSLISIPQPHLACRPCMTPLTSPSLPRMIVRIAVPTDNVFPSIMVFIRAEYHSPRQGLRR